MYNETTRLWDFVPDGTYKPCALCRGSGEQPPKVATAKITNRRGLGGWNSLWLHPFGIGEAVTIIPTSEYNRLLADIEALRNPRFD